MATRSDLRTRARIRADQDNSTFPTDTQYNYLLDEAGKEVWYDLLRAGWPISFSSAQASVPSTGLVRFVDDLSITDAVAFVRGVFRLDGGTLVELQPLNEGDRAAATSATGIQPSAYDVAIDMEDGLVVRVYPPQACTVVIHYVREWPGFDDDNAVWPGPARSDELLVLKAALKACRKEGNDQGAQFLAQEYEYLKECVQDMASRVNMRHSALIRDVGNPLGRTRLPGDFDVHGPDY